MVVHQLRVVSFLRQSPESILTDVHGPLLCVNPFVRPEGGVPVTTDVGSTYRRTLPTGSHEDGP